MSGPFRYRNWSITRHRQAGRAGVSNLQINQHLVDLVGIEPTTSSMPWKRAPSCATGPRLAGQLFYCRGLRGTSQSRRFNDRDRTGDLPGRPGRASGLLLRVDQHLDRAVRFPTLQLPFAAPSFHNCGELFLINQEPRASAAGGWRLSALVLCQSSLGIRS